jgi:PAS domain S-box-containing protein
MDAQKVRIVNALSGLERPINISEIARKTNLDRHAVARHLDTLELLGKVKQIHIGQSKKYLLYPIIPVSGLIDISSDLILILDTANIVQYINKAAITFLGKSGRSIIGERLDTLNIPPFSEPVVIRNLETFSFEKTQKLEISYESQWFELTIIAFSLSQGISLVSIIASNISNKKSIEQELKWTQDKYSAAFQLSPDAITITDMESGRILEYNSAAEKLFGYSRDDVLKMTTVELGIWDETTRQLHIDNHSLNDEFTIPVQQLYRKNETAFLASISGKIIQIGQKFVILSIIRDITKTLKDEEELRRSEKHYRLLAENTRDVIWTLDPVSGRFTYVSPSVERLRGYTVQEVLEQSIEEVMTVESFSRISEVLPKRIKEFLIGDTTNQGFYYRIDQPHKNGSIIPTEVLTTFIADKNNKIISILGVSRDITHQIEIETHLKRSEEKFRLITENIGDIVWILDIYSETFEYINQAITLLGYTPGEIIGNHYTMFMDYENNTSLSYDLKKRISAFESGDISLKVINTRVYLRHKNGSSILVENVSTLLTGSDDKVSKIVGISHDIRHYKKL